MNTKSNFDRRLILTISVLLTTIWLPLTTLAQDSTETTHLQILPDCEKSTEILTVSKVPSARILEKEVGFSETDPADQQSENIETVTWTFIVRAHVTVGFSETDPAADMFNSYGETDYQNSRRLPWQESQRRDP